MSDEKSIAAVLKRSKLFSTLGDGELSSLIRDSRTAEVSYTAGESIYSDTSYKKALGAVINGCLSVYRPGNGSRVLLNRIPAGGVFGAASLFGAEGMYVTEITAEKDSVIFFVPSEVLGRLITENGESPCRTSDFSPTGYAFSTEGYPSFQPAAPKGSLRNTFSSGTVTSRSA